MAAQTEREKVFSWRENITMLAEKEFFSLIHIYLGEVKSPFNKQKLAEQLEAILRNPDNQKTMLSLIDDFDAEVISVIALVPNISLEKLLYFLSDTYTQTEIALKIENLTERLIIYKEIKSENTDFFKINPVLEKLLQTKISASYIFRDSSYCLPENDLPANKYLSESQDICRSENVLPKTDPQVLLVPSSNFAVSPALLASFISYILEHPELCKTDGTFKKSDTARLEQIFSDRLPLLQTLFTALCHLLIIDTSEKKVAVNFKRLEEFAALTENMQCLFLSVATACPVSKNLLQTQASILADCIAAIPDCGFSRKNLWRAAWLVLEIQKSHGQIRSHSRFSRMIAASSSENSGDAVSDSDRSTQVLFEKIIDSALVFGLLKKKSETQASDGGAAQNANAVACADRQNKKVITISGLSVTIVPGLDLSEYIKLTPFLSIKKYDTAVDFELSKNSIFRAFNSGYDEQMILSLLERHSNFSLPQSLTASVNDWYNSYNSAVIFKGYVLKLDEKKAAVFEKNKKAFAHVSQKIATGVYLLDIANDHEADLFSFKAGFDFLANVNSTQKEARFLPFPIIMPSYHANIFFENIFAGKKNSPDETGKTEILNDNDLSAKIKDDLHKHLESLNLTDTKASVLHSYIERKIILSEKQLSYTFVQLGLHEARGTDFFGKIHVLENALGASEKVTVTMQDENDATKFISFTGLPVTISKKNGTAELMLKLDKSANIKQFSIAQLTNIKWHKKL